MRLIESTKLQDHLHDEHLRRVHQLDRPPRVEIYLGVDPQTGYVDPPSKMYVDRKTEYGRTVGVDVAVHEVSPSDIQDLILERNHRNDTDGQVVQHPLPGVEEIAATALYNSISRYHDVDGMSVGSLYTPATPLGIMRLLDYYDRVLAHHEFDLRDRKVALIGSEGAMIGRPLQALLKSAGAFVTPIDRKLGNDDLLQEAIHESDIIVSAVGKPGLIRPEYLKRGHVVIDAATRMVTVNGKRRQVGDLHPDAYGSGMEFWANQPRGVIGPLTVQMLMDNVISSAETRDSREPVNE